MLELRGYIREVHWSAELMGGAVLVNTVGPTLRGATIFVVGYREPKTNYGSHTARSTTCARGLADSLGRFCDTIRAWVVVGRLGDTMRWVREVIAGWFGLGCRRSGRFGDILHLG